MTDRVCSVCGDLLGVSLETGHVEVPVSVDDRHAHVDEGVQDLVEACWEFGVETISSCEEIAPGLASLTFEWGSVERFVSMLTAPSWRAGMWEDNDDFFHRMRSSGWIWKPGNWPWGAGFSVEFPIEDIPEVVSRLWGPYA